MMPPGFYMDMHTCARRGVPTGRSVRSLKSDPLRKALMYLPTSTYQIFELSVAKPVFGYCILAALILGS